MEEISFDRKLKIQTQNSKAFILTQKGYIYLVLHLVMGMILEGCVGLGHARVGIFPYDLFSDKRCPAPIKGEKT